MMVVGKVAAFEHWASFVYLCNDEVAMEAGSIGHCSLSSSVVNVKSDKSLILTYIT